MKRQKEGKYTIEQYVLFTTQKKCTDTEKFSCIVYYWQWKSCARFDRIPRFMYRNN